MDLQRAIEIAVQAHAGQVDKGGAPYILHPLRVMLAVEGEAAQIVGVLHDVVEDDADWTLSRLRGHGFSEEVLAGIDAVTRRDGEVYDTFMERAAANPIGALVKRADLIDNCDLSRIPHPSARDASRVERYRKALKRFV